jgi:hypothetical protein
VSIRKRRGVRATAHQASRTGTVDNPDRCWRANGDGLFMNVSARSALSAARDAFHAQLWPIPVTGVVLAVLAGIFLPSLDAGIDGNLPAGLIRWCFRENLVHPVRR